VSIYLKHNGGSFVVSLSRGIKTLSLIILAYSFVNVLRFDYGDSGGIFALYGNNIILHSYLLVSFILNHLLTPPISQFYLQCDESVLNER
jgi:hypothetical protein